MRSIAPAPSPRRGAAAVREHLVEVLRRDLIGPGPGDDDLAREVLRENPARWYLTGFLVPSPETKDTTSADRTEPDEEGDPPLGDDLMADPESGGGRAADNTAPDEPSSRPSRLPSSLGLTVLLDVSVTEVEVTLTWGDYVTEPPLPPEILSDENAKIDPRYHALHWPRVPGEAHVRLPVPNGRGKAIILRDSGGAERPIGALTIEAHARPYPITEPDGSVTHVRALTVMVVNRRSPVRRRFADLAYAFQVRLELRSEQGFYPRHDPSGLGASDADAALADLHYRDVAEYAVGRGTSAGWFVDGDGIVRRAFTDPLPRAEVERVEPNTAISGVVFGMEDLARLAADATGLGTALAALPDHYATWIASQSATIPSIVGDSRQATAHRLLQTAERARERIADGIALLRESPDARLAFRAMNDSVARAARRRNAGPTGDPAAEPPPCWRPFQLAFILLNLRGLAEPTHPDREVADLLFFPTGGGKTEAYLGLAAWTIAYRRLTHPGLTGAGVAVLMRYTLRLLTLDQLVRAAGVVCALELMRNEPAWQQAGRRLLGDWPIEIGLWVGSAATPNRLGHTGDSRDDTAVARIRHHRRYGRAAPAPIKACPWCGTPFTKESFACLPSDAAPKNMVIRCANLACDFTRDRPLPVLTVDEAIYRRLPAFLIATVDKFAALPWLGEVGAFFGHVDRADEWGFYGAADPAGSGRRLPSGAELPPPELIIQDELHLISGPLGTIAALYEVVLDRLASRVAPDSGRIRPKVVASTATVRRASAQVKALFDRAETAIFPPPGPDRRESFFAHTVASSEQPARLYVGLGSPGRGPKLMFLRALTSLLSAATAEAANGDADAYETAVCYFNALRELGGARRIVEDEVRARLAGYGTERRRVAPPDAPFADRRLRAPLELTSRVSADQVAEAKDHLASRADSPAGIDVALATNMISVGLDIGRLGLMLVQGQPKSAAEYIQATSRIGRRPEQPGLALVLLNVHKPRDRMHYEGFRQFHASFYRAVEATSVTPWAARALDRALAAVVVAAARHLKVTCTPEDTTPKIGDDPTLRADVVQLILDRAPESAVVGGHARLRAAIESILDDWIATAEQQTASGGKLYYGVPRDKALLHDPLDPMLASLAPPHRRFIAGRSMRDVEHTSLLRIVDPHGIPLH